MAITFQLSATAFASDQQLTFDDKLAAPWKSIAHADNPFEKQFVHDIAAPAVARVTEFSHAVVLDKSLAKNRMTFKFNLSGWPEKMQRSARLWIAVGATNAISTDGGLRLSFFQNGAGMTTDLNNAYNVDGLMVLGSDYAVTNGEITVSVVNKTSLSKVNFSVCAIAYVPETPAKTEK